MNSLRAYGCSFTHGYKEEILKGWVTRLKLSRKYKLINRGHAGAGWVTVRSYILNDIPKFKKGDVAIIQIPFLYRVEIPYFKTKYDSFMRYWNEQRGKTLEWGKFVKEEEELREVITQEVLQIFKILEALDVKVIWWSSQHMPELKKSKYEQLTLDGYDCYFDWSHTRYDLCVSEDDTHLNVKGYEYQAEFFSRQLNKILGGVI